MPAPTYRAEPSYASRYSVEAEEARPSAMPRRVTETRREEESGYSYPTAELNYPQTPTYRAQQEAPVEPARDFYAHDVPATEEFSSAPNVDDLPSVPTSAVESKPETPAENPFRELPQQPPVRRTEERTFMRPVREPEPEQTPEQPAVPETPAATEEPRRDLSISSLFSRGVTERTPIRPMGFGRSEEDKQEEKEEPTGRESLRFGDMRREEVSGQSRVFEAPVPERSDSTLFDDDDADEGDYREITAQPDPEPPARTFTPRDRTPVSRTPVRHEIPFTPAVPAMSNTPAPAPQKHTYKEYVRPSLDLFAQYDDSVKVSAEEIERNSAIIEETLSGFRIDAQVTDTTPSSAVTRYDIDIPGNISVSSVVKHDKELAMRLHSRDGVNMYANNKNGRISIEVPNTVRATVGLKTVMKADNYVNAKPNALMFALGNDVENNSVCENIVKMTHVLVAGSTNSGKSVCLNAMLVSLICKYSPEELRLILIDPKKVEFAVFDGLPH
ncbi:MAG: hypothetical protein K2N74_06085, partial [Clostridiales bacterium]|nr:hypothetical protein [Clostridiales bacterium]